MSEPTGNGPKHTPQDTDLNKELNDLIKNLESAVRSTIQSERARTLQREISAGIEQINAQFQLLTERGQQAINQAQQTMNQAQQQTQPNVFMQELQDMLTRGVASINQQLNEFSARMQSSSEGSTTAQNVPVEDDEPESGPANQPSATRRPPTSSNPSVQRVSIEEEPSEPATGETTRLD